MEGSEKWSITGISFVNDMKEVSCYTSLFADDAKLLRKIRNKNC